MRTVFASLLFASSLAFIGCSGAEEVGASSAALTLTDVDVAPECQGVIDFVNVASFATLDAYLPSNVAQNIVGHRATAPFVTLHDLASVSQVGDARLTQIHGAARTEGFIGSACVGIYDQLAVSTDDASAMVDLVNTVSSTELHDYLPYAWNGAVNLLGARPFATVAQISATSGIGTVSLRNLRNAATLTKPFEQLAAAATALHRDADLVPHFDWYALLDERAYRYLHSMVCFGIDPAYLPNGTDVQEDLATAEEVRLEVTTTLAFANRYGELTLDPAPGLASLDARIQGRSFFGCYINYANDPWSGNNMSFFVDTETGFGVLTETRWSE